MQKLRSLHRHAFKTVCCLSCTATWWVLNRLSINLWVFEWSHQILRLFFHVGHPPLSSTQPIPVYSQFSPLHTHPAFANTATATHSYRMRRSHRPKMDPFTAEGAGMTKNIAPCLFLLVYTVSLLLPPSLTVSLCLQTQNIRLQNSISHLCFPLENFITVPCPHRLLFASFPKQLPPPEQRIGMFAHTWNAGCRSCIYVA